MACTEVWLYHVWPYLAHTNHQCLFLWVVASVESYEERRRKIKHENKCVMGSIGLDFVSVQDLWCTFLQGELHYFLLLLLLLLTSSSSLLLLLLLLKKKKEEEEEKEDDEEEIAKEESKTV